MKVLNESTMLENEYGTTGSPTAMLNKLRELSGNKIGDVFAGNQNLFNSLDPEFDLDDMKDKDVQEFIDQVEACKK